VAHGERERHNAVEERAMCSGPKSKATGPSWVYDWQPGSKDLPDLYRETPVEACIFPAPI
jgi:hypothetical protein